METNKQTASKDTKEEVADRLQQIRAALESMAAANKEEEAAKNKIVLNKGGFVCPVDPAERANCEACQ